MIHAPLTRRDFARLGLSAAAISLVPPLARAAPVPYALDRARSQVGFTYLFSGKPTNGTMPVASANMQLDLDRISQSRVAVTLDPTRARAGFAFATQAMKGKSVLDTDAHPRITFRSTSVTGTVQDARVTGQLTIRGATRPVTLRAGLYRQQGTDVGSRDKIAVLLTGSVDRTDFGADGWPGYVGNRIDLRILARLDRS